MKNTHVSNYEKLVNRFGRPDAPISAVLADGVTVSLSHYFNTATEAHFVLQFVAPDGRVLRTNWFHKVDMVAGVCHERPLDVDAVAAILA